MNISLWHTLGHCTISAVTGLFAYWLGRKHGRDNYVSCKSVRESMGKLPPGNYGTFYVNPEPIGPRPKAPPAPPVRHVNDSEYSACKGQYNKDMEQWLRDVEEYIQRQRSLDSRT